ncbi:MAG: flagellar basal body rod protein FlgC [Rhodospirillales bacterium]|nr:flagellar basal body rod protein FlgC [Rhodospirillales bacterium]MDE1883127.1 flagellar basal body rod protein FlgC [Rhodospirillales bacterium]MDE2458778.1 flagellar basal body rod protein FlgC [Rhodospirillales bacterium]
MSGSIFSIIGSALNAQDLRMGAISSNLANASSVAAPGEQPYRAHELVFQAQPVVGGEYDGGDPSGNAGLGVQVVANVQSNAPPAMKYDPGNPYANASGYVTSSNVSPVEEMVNMIDSSHSYSASVAMLQQASRIDQQMINSFQVA